MAKGQGTEQSPWQLTTPSGSSKYEMYKDETANPPALVCMVGKTELRYQLRDRRPAQDAQGERRLGGARQRGRAKAAAEGTVEAWGRSTKNQVGGWYGLRKGYRGRFGMYMPPLLEALEIGRA